MHSHIDARTAASAACTNKIKKASINNNHKWLLGLHQVPQEVVISYRPQVLGLHQVKQEVVVLG